MHEFARFGADGDAYDRQNHDGRRRYSNDYSDPRCITSGETVISLAPTGSAVFDGDYTVNYTGKGTVTTVAGGCKTSA